ncbi:LPS translocon maturation chaperone LptM [Tepidimonas fonticaldi]|nr:lipoprotein [Tepidimonas fonticaldi]
MQRSRRIVGPRLAAWAAVLAMTLSGCGQKGPLTLPSAPQPPAATTDAPR